MAPSDFSSAVDALERHAAKLSHAVDNLEGWLLCATIIVVIGLVIEALEAAEYVHEQKSRRARGMGIEWTKGAILIGAFLVLVGVFGEGAIQFVASKDEAQRYIDEQNIDRLRTAEAIDAEGRIATLQKSTADAQRDAANANERANGLEAQATASQRDAEQARLAQKRIENAVAWRNLPPDTQSALATRLAALSGGTIEISWPEYDDEALGLAIQFESTVEQANTLAGKQLWTMSDRPRLFAQAIFFGVRVNGANPEKVLSVRQAFDAVGLPHEDGSPIPNFSVFGPDMRIGGGPPTDVQIWVGTKPRPN